MRVLNFSHPLDEGHRRTLAQMTGQTVTFMRHMPLQCDPLYPFAPQVREVLDTISLNWQVGQWVVILPGHSVIAALILAELHGRIGHFPTIVRLQRVAGETLARYVIAEVVNLQHIRDEARGTRQGGVR